MTCETAFSIQSIRPSGNSISFTRDAKKKRSWLAVFRCKSRQPAAHYSRLRGANRIKLATMSKKIAAQQNAFRPNHVSMETPLIHEYGIDHEEVNCEVDLTPHEAKSSSNELRIGRELGPIETMHHLYTLNGIDMISIVLMLQSRERVLINHVRDAMRCLMKRHPLLRMKVREERSLGGTTFKFVEMEKLKTILSVSSETDWRRVLQGEINKRFDSSKGPLWRCKLIDTNAKNSLQGKQKIENRQKSMANIKAHGSSKSNDSTNTCSKSSENHPRLHTYHSCVNFTWHHSIIDGGYISWVVRDFIIFLDAAISNPGLTPNEIKSLPLMPSIENVLTTTSLASMEQFCEGQSTDEPDANKRYSIVQWKHKEPCRDILNKYTEKYADEIRRLSKTPSSNTHVPVEFNQQQTTDILMRCKQRGISVNGAIWAASVASLVDMLYVNDDLPETLNIPFEFLLDLRKHFSLNPISSGGFAGVASTNVTLAAECSIKQVPIGHVEFWEIAKSFNSGIKQEAKSLDVIDLINSVREENKTFQDFPMMKVGKSPFVLCVSNVGVLDVLVPGDVSTRIKLTELHGNSSILIEDMPIFLIGTHTLGGKLCCSISYCANYTSTDTAEEFSWRFQRYLCGGSKL